MSQDEKKRLSFNVKEPENTNSRGRGPEYERGFGSTRRDDVVGDEKGSKKSSNQTVDLGSKRKSFEDESVPEKKTFSIQLNSSKAKSKKVEPVLEKKPMLSVFNEDSDSEEEEMPLECRMKMRNIGRDTVTSSGPKSFNKGKNGFTNNAFKQFELSMKPRNSMEKRNEFDK